jgi:Ca2+-binding EF-hand superfamily protein
MGDASVQAADEDGSGELEMTEFLEKLGPLIGSEENMSMREVAKLFMKIDADSNGGVDWWDEPLSLHAC